MLNCYGSFFTLIIIMSAGVSVTFKKIIIIIICYRPSDRAKIDR